MKRERGQRRKTIGIEENSGLGREFDVIQLVNGSELRLVGGLSGAGSSRGIRSNFVTLKNESGDVIEMDMRDGSHRVICTVEELEEED